MFFQFWEWLLRFDFHITSKRSSFLWEENFEIIFATLYFYLYELKKFYQIFKILSQTGHVNIFVLRGVFFSSYVQLKNSFCDEKTAKNLRHTFVEKLSKINVAKY